MYCLVFSSCPLFCRGAPLSQTWNVESGFLTDRQCFLRNSGYGFCIILHVLWVSLGLKNAKNPRNTLMEKIHLPGDLSEFFNFSISHSSSPLVLLVAGARSVSCTFPGFTRASCPSCGEGKETARRSDRKALGGRPLFFFGKSGAVGDVPSKGMRVPFSEGFRSIEHHRSSRKPPHEHLTYSPGYDSEAWHFSVMRPGNPGERKPGEPLQPEGEQRNWSLRP